VAEALAQDVRDAAGEVLLGEVVGRSRGGR
jgi:hypothetical protein